VPARSQRGDRPSAPGAAAEAARCACFGARAWPPFTHPIACRKEMGTPAPPSRQTRSPRRSSLLVKQTDRRAPAPPRAWTGQKRAPEQGPPPGDRQAASQWRRRPGTSHLIGSGPAPRSLTPTPASPALSTVWVLRLISHLLELRDADSGAATANSPRKPKPLPSLDLGHQA